MAGNPGLRWGKRIGGIALPIAATIATAVAINIWAARHPLRFDWTSERIHSLTRETKRVLAALPADVGIAFFYDLRSRANLDAKALLERYAAASPRVQLQSFDPMLQPAAARRYGVSFPGTTVFASGARRVVVQGDSESDFTNALVRVVSSGFQRVCFSDGHVENDPLSLSSHDHFEAGMGSGHSHSDGGRPLRIEERHGMGRAREGLEAMGFEVVKRSLLGGEDPLGGCAVLVIASPRVAFRTEEVAQLRAFLRSGGAALVLLEPGVANGLDGVLAEFGIALGDHPVVDEASHYWTDAAVPAVRSYPRHRATRDLALTFYPGAAPLVPAGEGIPDRVLLTPLVDTHGTGQTLVVYAIRATGPDDREALRARLVVAGDGDFATNSFFPVLGNGQLFLNLVNLLAGYRDVVAIPPRGYRAARLELTNRELRFTFLVSTLVLPGLLALAGLAVWWRGRS